MSHGHTTLPQVGCVGFLENCAGSWAVSGLRWALVLPGVWTVLGERCGKRVSPVKRICVADSSSRCCSSLQVWYLKQPLPFQTVHTCMCFFFQTEGAGFLGLTTIIEPRAIAPFCVKDGHGFHMTVL